MHPNTNTNMAWTAAQYAVEIKVPAWLLNKLKVEYKLLWNATGAILQRDVIYAHPEFADHFETSGTERVLSLSGACSCSANILVLYLLTGTYQDISGRCGCDDFLERRTDRGFHRPLRANMLAVKYDLHELSTMAKMEFHKEGNQLKLGEILQMLCDIQWFESDDSEDKDLVEYLFERAASILPGEEDETIVLKDYLGDEEWPYEALFNSVLKQIAEMQALKRQAS